MPNTRLAKKSYVDKSAVDLEVLLVAEEKCGLKTCYLTTSNAMVQHRGLHLDAQRLSSYSPAMLDTAF